MLRLSCLVIACFSLLSCYRPDERLEIYALSTRAVLVPKDSAANVVGLVFDFDLSAKHPVVVNVGCAGKVIQSFEITPGKSARKRIDWYTTCTELSFSSPHNEPTTIVVSYSFQTI
jgi:hypothetical protein